MTKLKGNVAQHEVCQDEKKILRRCIRIHGQMSEVCYSETLKGNKGIRMRKSLSRQVY